jgi:hypothetical protein
MIDQVLQYLDLEALQKVRENCRQVVELTAKILASAGPEPPVRRVWEHEVAVRELRAVEAEIEKRTSTI